ncbi:hypothetical protein DFH05DRAFT_1522959 [Lentinula detonsa]|uniref:Uncharacterized protein n=1 Tax=Lentinula detonsa TaxID=2804962 RepID=A0A9W8P466_9AGAR|nr:hypothetical protein DFH05DRAFT_1522959 [Lentinula detonsa]
MSTTSTITETTQQHRDRLLLSLVDLQQLLRVQAERQRAREAEEARQAAEFEAEMKALEEEAAREAEIAAEKKRLEEKKLAEQKGRAEEKRKETERVAQERAKALKKLAEDKRKEEDARVKVTEELAKRRELTAAAALRRSGPPTSQSASSSKPKTNKMVKSPSQVRNESEELTEEEEEQPTPRGVKQKVMRVMIGNAPDPDDGYDPASGDDGEDPASPSPSQSRPPCDRCVLQHHQDECRPQEGNRRAQACAVCHHQRQRCSWSGENAARRSRVKRTKLEDEVYEGPTRRVTERRIGMEQVAMFAEHNREVERRLQVIERYTGRTAMAMERVAMALEGLGGGKKREEEDNEDREGDDKEEEEEEEEEERRRKIREGKKRAE